ncbi:MAG: SecDF P1 head subdomain-containing protein [Nannocystaceae bacterium]|nr:hypothetical protein [bacterium]
MLRRTFIMSAAAAAGLAACGGSHTKSSTPPFTSADLEFVLIDAQTPFGAGTSPYLTALRDEGPGVDTGIDWVVLGDYGRDDGAGVRAPVVAVADRRETLEAYFSGLGPEWTLPPSHGLRYEHGPWPDGPPRWGARVVRLPAVITAENLVRAEAKDASVSLQLDAEGTAALERTSGANIGQRLAIVVDAEIVARPVINARISGGTVQVSLPGGASASETLATRLTVG